MKVTPSICELPQHASRTLSECLLQLLSCTNSKIYFRTCSNYVPLQEERRPSERVASSRIVGRCPTGTASDSKRQESEDDDTDDGAEGFSHDSVPAMTSSQLSSSSASANSAAAPSAASRRPEGGEETSADVFSTPSGRKPPGAGKRRRKGPSKESTTGVGGDKFKSTLVHYMECASQKLSSPPTSSHDPREKSFMDDDELFCMGLKVRGAWPSRSNHRMVSDYCFCTARGSLTPVFPVVAFFRFPT